ncbi:MAG: MATE family efflux transporter [Lachnospiraceae bacterium]|nr:MATE family efflux transporter [Lachnospiraceae bacterium]
MNIRRQFAKYVSQNILGMIGLSCYILADSYFISKAQGADGLTALNLVLPLYNLIFAIGSMIGIGSAIRYVITRAKDETDADTYLFNAVVFTTVIGVIFAMIGFLFPDKIMAVLGADDTIIKTGKIYTQIFLSFSPVFMWNYVANAYVRNDGAPTVAMVATLCSSLFNIVFDYVLMFPLHMGMAGAALATAFSPVVGIAICMVHLLSKRSHIKLKICAPSVKKLVKSCQLGIAAFVGEMSSGVITLAFNFLILNLAGNVGVAAYGVVANISLVTVAVFTGIAQGSQPLISRSYGNGNKKEVHLLQNLSFAVSVLLAIALYAILFFGAESIVAIFNHDHNDVFAEYARTGIQLYFIGILFAGQNIVGSNYFSATEKAREAFLISILRGFVLILFFAFVMALLFGLNGVWLAYAVAEACVTILMVVFLIKGRENPNRKLL